jgi:hypothetical protein
MVDDPGAMPAADATMLSTVEGIYGRVVDRVEAVLDKVAAGRLGDARQTLQAVSELRAAYGILMEERAKVDKLRKQVAGVVGGSTLDLDAARDEIGRRLARLRDAGGGERLSDRAE